MKVLFINACVRENSRTYLLAEKVLSEIGAEVEEVVLETEKIQPLDRERLALRDQLLREGKKDDAFFRYAHQFASADHIVIAAPFWDLGFPALLKVYLEAITVAGVTFTYQDGVPMGLCRAKKLTYVTTSGGTIFSDFGYTYVKALAEGLYSIPKTECYRAENLDVYAISAERFWQDAKIEHLIG